MHFTLYGLAAKTGQSETRKRIEFILLYYIYVMLCNIHVHPKHETRLVTVAEPMTTCMCVRTSATSNLCEK
jgi:hypothetical protein